MTADSTNLVMLKTSIAAMMLRISPHLAAVFEVLPYQIVLEVSPHPVILQIPTSPMMLGILPHLIVTL
jgi:hypothetical protein